MNLVVELREYVKERGKYLDEESVFGEKLGAILVVVASDFDAKDFEQDKEFRALVLTNGYENLA